MKLFMTCKMAEILDMSTQPRVMEIATHCGLQRFSMYVGCELCLVSLKSLRDRKALNLLY